MARAALAFLALLALASGASATGRFGWWLPKWRQPVVATAPVVTTAPTVTVTHPFGFWPWWDRFCQSAAPKAKAVAVVRCVGSGCPPEPCPPVKCIRAPCPVVKCPVAKEVPAQQVVPIQPVPAQQVSPSPAAVVSAAPSPSPAVSAAPAAAGATAAAGAAAQAGAAASPAPTPAPSAKCQTVADVASADPELSTLVAAVSASGALDALSNPDLVATVLAPTNQAFSDLLSGLNMTAESALAPENLPVLQAILATHIIPDKAARAADLTDGQKLATLNEGEELTVRKTGGTVSFVPPLASAPTANVVQADIPACKAIIHKIDAVLIPTNALSGSAGAQSTSTAGAQSTAEESPSPVQAGGGTAGGAATGSGAMAEAATPGGSAAGKASGQYTSAGASVDAGGALQG